ncbi:nuclease [Coemansia brasiliensis]|uniref:Nuclease n=1 Tax=Coemansia brasiliensis TaxID=2650707 RepID=A0A9W8LYU0_9FUNG|nr:nuclease [Coemansia brasiliensis]
MHRIVTFVAGTLLGGGVIYAVNRPANKQQPAQPVQYAQPAQPVQPTQFDKRAVDETDNEFLKFGYPGPVSDFLLRSRYAVSYNRALRNPNWVAEHLTRENLQGTADRANSEFHEDPEIPQTFRALLKDYYRSGYDRGHMCPAADAKKDTLSMNETFFLTNIAPQVGKGFNRNYWASLETFVRDLTKSFDDVYCISGPLYLPQKEGDKWMVKYEVIGNPPNVAVPTHFFKVILAKRRNESGFAIGAFALPNKEIDNSVPLTNFSFPLEYVEKAAGLKFFEKIEPFTGWAILASSSAALVSISQYPFDKNEDNPLKYGNPGPISDLLVRSRYTASYNRALRNPNWVAEHLTRENLNGTADRTSADFKEDPEIPQPFRALLKDYYRSGYDRGHMCPAADAKKDEESMKETFLLSNIAPQTGVGFNRQYWAYLESFVRDLTKAFDNVYCISGPLYLPHREGDKWVVTYEVIGDPPNVAVPTHFFKAILVQQNDNPVNGIGVFALPNKAIDSSTPLVNFNTSLEDVERASGLTLYEKIPRTQAVSLCKLISCKL